MWILLLLGLFFLVFSRGLASGNCLACGIGAPVGITSTGLPVFEPHEMGGLRLTVENPMKPPVRHHLAAGRAGVYRHDGFGQWSQTATLAVEELRRLAPLSRTSRHHGAASLELLSGSPPT